MLKHLLFPLLAGSATLFAQGQPSGQRFTAEEYISEWKEAVSYTHLTLTTSDLV